MMERERHPLMGFFHTIFLSGIVPFTGLYTI